VGSAGPVFATKAGALLATPAGLELYDGNNFRPLLHSLPQASSASISLAVDATGFGWAVSGNRGIGRIAPEGVPQASAPVSQAPVVRLSQPGAGTPATVAVGTGDRALAVAGQRAAVVAGAVPHELRGPGVPVRSAALTGPSQGWAIADSGQLLAERAGTWSVAGDQPTALQQLADARRSLGAAPVTAAGANAAPAGFAALAFRSPADGYAVGAAGLIAHYDGSAWKRESAPAPVDLRDVAAGPAGIVAVGAHGTLLESDGHSWQASQKAASLVGGQDFTAAAALPDGALLAVAGGSLIERPSGGSWQAAPIAPLGVSVSKLAGYRDGAGGLHALALVQGSGGLSLLDGDGTRWQAVATPAGFALNDFAVDARSGKLWVAGSDGQGAATVALPLPADARPGGPSTPFNGLLRSLGL
jgi:hypothetical protein